MTPRFKTVLGRATKSKTRRGMPPRRGTTMAEVVKGRTVSTNERPGFALPGILGLLLVLLSLGAGIATLLLALRFTQGYLLVVAIPLLVLALLALGGLFILQPNEAAVLLFLGKYRGTERRTGWHWTVPFYTRRRVSLRIHNFNSARLKVNDAEGNPIEIASVVVWRVVDTARATFDMENYAQFIEVQSETAIRHLASNYPYDVGSTPGETSLRGGGDEVARALRAELGSRLDLAGIEVLEARLTHLAYSPEIAGAMLQRQQAAAILAARQRIVQGAVSMVELVLGMLRQKRIVDLSPAQKAELVTNLLIVLTSERGAQPVLQTGTTAP